MGEHLQDMIFVLDSPTLKVDPMIYRLYSVYQYVCSKAQDYPGLSYCCISMCKYRSLDRWSQVTDVLSQLRTPGLTRILTD